MKATGIMYVDSFKLSNDSLNEINMSIEAEDLGMLFDAISGIPGVGFMKMYGYTVDVLDYNSYTILTIRVDVKFNDYELYRFN